jgi:UrcA family protein
MMNTKTTLATLVLLGGVCLGSVAGSASAQSIPAGDVSIKVQSSDLDLSRSAGAKVMLQRIHNAAAKICGPAPTDWLHDGRQYEACIKTTTDHAVERLGSPQVTAMNDGAPAPVRVAEASDRP